MKLNGRLCRRPTATNLKIFKKGAVTPGMLIVLVTLVLGGLFFAVEVPIRLIQQNTMTDTLANASSSAVTRIREDKIKEGVAIIDPDKATDAAYEIISEAFGMRLNANKRGFVDITGSPFKSEPKIVVKIVEKPLEADENWSKTVQIRENGDAGAVLDTVKVKESSVLVYMKAEYKSLVLKRKKSMTLERTSVSQVKIREKIT